MRRRQQAVNEGHRWTCSLLALLAMGLVGVGCKRAGSGREAGSSGSATSPPASPMTSTASVGPGDAAVTRKAPKGTVAVGPDAAIPRWEVLEEGDLRKVVSGAVSWKLVQRQRLPEWPEASVGGSPAPVSTNGLGFSVDGRRVAFGSSVGLLVYETSTWKRLRVFPSPPEPTGQPTATSAPKGEYTSPTFSRDGKRVGGIALDGNAVLFSVDTGLVVGRTREATRRIGKDDPHDPPLAFDSALSPGLDWAVYMSPEGAQMLHAFKDGRSHTLRAKLRKAHHTANFFTDSSAVIVSAVGGSIPWSWVTKLGARRVLYDGEGAACEGWGTRLACLGSRSRTGGGSALLLRELGRDAPLREIELPSVPMILSMSGNGRVLAVRVDAEIWLFSLPAGEVIASVPGNDCFGEGGNQALSPDGKRLVCSRSGQVWVYSNEPLPSPPPAEVHPADSPPPAPRESAPAPDRPAPPSVPRSTP